MKNLLVLAAAMFGVLEAEMVNAQPSDPVAAYLALNESTVDREDLRSMAKCIALRYPTLIQTVIRSQDTSQDSKHLLIDKGCFKTRFFRKSQFMITGWYYSILAEYLLINSYKSTNLPDITRVPPLDHPELPAADLSKMPAQYRSGFVVSHWNHNVDTLAECVARTLPNKVYALLQSTPDSPQEGQIFSQLQATLAGCQASTLSPAPPRPLLRAALGESLYRLFDYAQPIDYGKAKPNA